MDWGDVPTWWAAVAASLALLAAASTIKGDRDSLRILRAEASARDEREQRAQANRVLLIPADVTLPDPTRAPSNFEYPTLKLRNASDLPIFEVRVSHVTPGITVSMGMRMIVAPGDSFDVRLPPDLIVQPGRSLREYQADFRDSSGCLWFRYLDGTLDRQVF